MRYYLFLILIYSVLGCVPESNDLEKPKNIEPLENSIDPQDRALKFLLDRWALAFIEKIDSNYQASINFQLSDSTNQYHVNIQHQGFEVLPGFHPFPNFTFESTLEHFNKIYQGEMTALTSMGQASSADPIPLVPNLLKPVKDNLVNDFLFFSQRFFNSTPYDLVKLGETHSRIVHGGHAIPIFYQKSDDIGVRSAWYQINKGEQVNEIGDTNPFPQYFIINSGNGFAKIGSDTISIQANQAYFIPPNSDHVFWNEKEDPLIMIFLAWGKGA